MLNGEDTSAADSRISFYRVNPYERYMRYYHNTDSASGTQPLEASGVGATAIAVDSANKIYIAGSLNDGISKPTKPVIGKFDNEGRKSWSYKGDGSRITNSNTMLFDLLEYDYFNDRIVGAMTYKTFESESSTYIPDKNIYVIIVIISTGDNLPGCSYHVLPLFVSVFNA